MPVETREVLRAISREEGISVQEATVRAVTLYRRRRILVEANEAYARLRTDPEASREFDNDPPGWDNALADGLEDY